MKEVSPVLIKEGDDFVEYFGNGQLGAIVSVAEIKFVTGGCKSGTHNCECLNTIELIAIAGNYLVWKLEDIDKAEDLLACHTRITW